jgi:hypothetical protein
MPNSAFDVVIGFRLSVDLQIHQVDYETSFAHFKLCGV